MLELRGGGELIWAMPESKHSFFVEVIPRPELFVANNTEIMHHTSIVTCVSIKNLEGAKNRGWVKKESKKQGLGEKGKQGTEVVQKSSCQSQNILRDKNRALT